MSENNTLLSKGLYHHPQPEKYIFLKEYIFKTCEEKRCLFLRCVNETDARIDYVELVVTQKNSKGKTIGKKRVAHKVSAAPGASFAIPVGIVVDPECSDFKVSFTEARSGAYTYREKNHKVCIYYTPKKSRPKLNYSAMAKPGVSSRKKTRAIGLTVLLFILMWIVCGIAVFISFNQYYLEEYGETWVDHVMPDIDVRGFFESLGEKLGEWFEDLGDGIADGFSNLGDGIADAWDSFIDFITDIDFDIFDF